MKRPQEYAPEEYAELPERTAHRLRRFWRTLPGMRATAPNGAPFPLRSWPPDAAIDIQNLANWVDPIKPESVRRFASASARDTGIPSPTEGMMCYLADTGTVQQHNGFRWVGDVGWVTFTPVNGWAALTPAPSARCDHLGQVTMRGRVNRSTAWNATVFTVPTNYCPEGAHFFATIASAADIEVAAGSIATSGAYTVSAPSRIGATPPFTAYLSTVYQTNFKAWR